MIWYYIEGYEDKLYDDYDKACEELGEMTDFYTDESLLTMCEDRIYEIDGIEELLDHCESNDLDVYDLVPNFDELNDQSDNDYLD